MERVPLHERNPTKDLLEPYDLLFARQSIVTEGAGQASIFVGGREPTTFESHLIRARIDRSKADPFWMFYFFESPQGRSRVRSIVNQVSAAGIRGSDLGQLLIPLLPLTEQQRAAAVLRIIDDKIESNRRLAALLEQITASLFRARFIDFVGVEGFDESEIGPIPSGWSVSSIGDCLAVVGGGTPSTKESRYWDGGTHCWATPKDLAGTDSLILLDTQRRITDEGVRRISSRLLPERTVLLSSRAPVGYTAMAFVEVAVNQGFIAIPPCDSLPSEYVLMWLRENMDQIKAHASGTTFAEISKRAFRPLPILVPSPPAVSEFRQFAAPVFDLLAALEARVLAKMRDALLPRLVSGTIRVPATGDSKEVIGQGVTQLAGASP